MDKIVTKVTIELKSGKVLELTNEEYNELAEAIGKPVYVPTYVPYVQPIIDYPKYPQVWYTNTTSNTLPNINN